MNRLDARIKVIESTIGNAVCEVGNVTEELINKELAKIAFSKTAKHADKLKALSALQKDKISGDFPFNDLEESLDNWEKKNG